jgi:adenylosuccinate synthase
MKPEESPFAYDACCCYKERDSMMYEAKDLEDVARMLETFATHKESELHNYNSRQLIDARASIRTYREIAQTLRQTKMDNTALIATCIEFGFKECERGSNIQRALEIFFKLP